MTDYVLTGLVKRRAELAGEIEAVHEKLRGLLAALEHIDATIVQFDPGHVVEGIRPKAFRPPRDWTKHGQMCRIVLSILRQATELMTKRVGVALHGQRENGTVRSQPGPGMMLLWDVTKSKA